ncbi:MAG: hypothetical protein V1725_05305 [archaeon]
MGEKLFKQYYVDGGTYDRHLVNVFSSEQGYSCKIMPSIINPLTKKIVDVDFSTTCQIRDEQGKTTVKDLDGILALLTAFISKEQGKISLYH